MFGSPFDSACRERALASTIRARAVASEVERLWTNDRACRQLPSTCTGSSMGSSIASFTSGTPVTDGSVPALRVLGTAEVLGAAAGAGGLTCAATGELARHEQSRHALRERIARIDSVPPQIGKHKAPGLTAVLGSLSAGRFNVCPACGQAQLASFELATPRFAAFDGSPEAMMGCDPFSCHGSAARDPMSRHDR
jgi:hypothetical protein